MRRRVDRSLCRPLRPKKSVHFLDDAAGRTPVQLTDEFFMPLPPSITHSRMRETPRTRSAVAHHARELAAAPRARLLGTLAMSLLVGVHTADRSDVLGEIDADNGQWPSTPLFCR
jgi:hypothetical protein